jgi:hypothetical protein
MEDIEDDWESFLHNEMDYSTNTYSNNNDNNNMICKTRHSDHANDINPTNPTNLQNGLNNTTQISVSDPHTTSFNMNSIPKCSDIYISTKTKICYLNKSMIDIKNVFWEIPVLQYHIPQDGVIKKQTKFSSTSKLEVDYIEEQLKKVKSYDEQIIEHIDNPEGRIKYKDQRKISVGICKKDIISYRSKKKRAFFNCFVLILRVLSNGLFREIHVKVFNTGKLEIPGIQNDHILEQVLTLLVTVLKPYVGEDLMFRGDLTETVLINSNFNCGYYIDRNKLHDLLKFKYRINSNFDACSYPGIQSKFYYDNTIMPDKQTGQQPAHTDFHEVSFMVFRTGSVLVVGKCEDNILFHIYDFLKDILETQYQYIRTPTVDQELTSKGNANRKQKPRKKIILFNIEPEPQPV